MWFYTMKHVLTDTLKVLHGHNWVILKAPAGLGWFTSDDPVICLNFQSESIMTSVGAGIARGAISCFH